MRAHPLTVRAGRLDMLAPVRKTLGRVLVAALAVLAAACGSSSPSGPTAKIKTVTSSSGAGGGAHTPVTPAIRRTVALWAAADSAQTACAVMSYGFKYGVGHGKPPAQCTSWINQAYGPFTASPGHVISASKLAGQISVLANIGGHIATLYLVQECGSLKINSIGVFSEHKSPPSCS